jgi:hypothetical protein
MFSGAHTRSGRPQQRVGPGFVPSFGLLCSLRQPGQRRRRGAEKLAQAVGHLGKVDDRGELHRHLGGCLSCRVRLRSLRAVERGPRDHRRPSAVCEAA